MRGFTQETLIKPELSQNMESPYSVKWLTKRHTVYRLTTVNLGRGTGSVQSSTDAQRR
jgi:hypothetical protein